MMPTLDTPSRPRHAPLRRPEVEAPGPGWRRSPSGVWLPPYAGEVAQAGAGAAIVGSRRRGATVPALPTANLLARYRLGNIAELWKNNARSTPVTTTGDEIKGITDASGNGHHLELFNTNGPQYKTNLGPSGALPGTHFLTSPTNSTLRSVDLFGSSSTSRTYYFIGQITAGDDTVFFSRSTTFSSGSQVEYAYYHPTPQSDALLTVSGRVAGVSGQFPTSAYGVFCMVVAGTSLSSYLDNVLKASGTVPSAQQVSSACLVLNGYRPNDTSFGGELKVLEFLIYDVAHSTERADVQAYAAYTYGTPS